MTDRLDILKTFKLYIDGKFPRSESGRTMLIHGKPAAKNKPATPLAHACKASRKDLRDAVEAARKAQPAWSSATPYLRGQILYRIAEMLEGKRRELAELIAAVGEEKTTAKPIKPDAEVSAAIDRLVAFAGWADKYAQVLGCNNPVSGPFYNFTVPEPTGVVMIVSPDAPCLLGLVSLLAPAICAGNTAVCLASQRQPLPAMVLAEACATGDCPAGVINLLSGERAELLKVIASHRDIDAVHTANLTADESAALARVSRKNLKRVTVRDIGDWTDANTCHSPWWIESFVEMKTMWHPASA